jgi:hypothetical protein
MNAAAQLLSAVLAGAETESTAAHPVPVQTVELATLTPLTARPGPGRFVFLPGSFPGLNEGRPSSRWPAPPASFAVSSSPPVNWRTSDREEKILLPAPDIPPPYAFLLRGPR